jgi:quercetin dioxygenase-like cupin family protein
MRACWLVAACLGLAGAAAGPALAMAAEVLPVTVEALGPVTPPGAPGQALYLVRYRIAPATRLPLHHHEGTQIGLVEAGVLTYHVETGEVPVYAAGGSTAVRTVRTVRAGETAEIGPGQWVVEEPDDRHWGANEGGEPLVIVTSALLREGAPLATRDQP